MKKKIWNIMFLVGITLTMLTACDNKAKQQQPIETDITKQDSIARLKAEENKARSAFEDSVAIYAWGDAKFGMSKKEALQTKAFSGAQKYEYGLGMSYENEVAIQRSLHMYDFPSIWADFGGEKNGELIDINIRESIEWDHFDYLTSDMLKLMAVFESKYGKPKNIYTDLSNLKYTDVDKAKIMIIADWRIGSGKGSNGTKMIEVEMTTHSETSYEYKIIIRNPAFPKHVNQKTEKEIAVEKERAQKNKEVMDNSF